MSKSALCRGEMFTNASAWWHLNLQVDLPCSSPPWLCHCIIDSAVFWPVLRQHSTDLGEPNLPPFHYFHYSNWITMTPYKVLTALDHVRWNFLFFFYYCVIGKGSDQISLFLLCSAVLKFCEWLREHRPGRYLYFCWHVERLKIDRRN